MVVVVTAAGRGVELGHIQAGQELPVDGWNTIHTIHTIHTTKFTDTRSETKEEAKAMWFEVEMCSEGGRMWTWGVGG